MREDDEKGDGSFLLFMFTIYKLSIDFGTSILYDGRKRNTPEGGCNMANLIDIEHLSKSYGKNKVLEDISVSFEGGNIIGLLGPNGSGKTSLIKIMTGLINDYEGSVKIDGHSPDPYTKSIVAYLPEKTYLADWMRPVDAVNYFADFYEDFDKAKAVSMINSFRLPMKQKIKSMSKGMQEKLQLVLVMCRKARLYLLDEPLGGVDPAARAFILDFIMKNYAENAPLSFQHI